MLLPDFAQLPGSTVPVCTLGQFTQRLPVHTLSSGWQDRAKALNTLICTSRCGRTRSLTFDPQRTVLLALLTTAVLGGALLYSGFRLGSDTQARAQLAEITALQIASRQQQAAITGARDSARANLDALALRLGRMQAEMLRLDALGERLVAQAGLDTAEFDFDIPPPVGGPQHATALSVAAAPDFLDMLEELDGTLADREDKLLVLEQLLMDRKLNRRTIPSGLPVEHGVLSSKFGKRIDPFTGKQDYHKGIDIAAKAGTEVVAVGDGVVTWSGERSGYGKLVEINHGSGYITRYAHNRDVLVSSGETVKKDHPIALLGSTGRSTGPHVHFEVLRNGKQVNPARYLN